METVNTNIFDYDSSIDVTHKINSMELDNWINHLQYIKKELNNLIGTCYNGLNILEAYDLIERFEKKQTENENLLIALLKYANSRMAIAECEDTPLI